MDAEHRLDRQICFALHAAARAATAGYREALAELDLTYTQYVTLLALWDRDGRTVSELGSTLHLDSGTLSPLLRRMATGGLVERRREGEDGRVVTVHLTDEGRALEVEACTMQDRLVADLDMDTDELETLRRLAHRFSESATRTINHEGVTR